MLYVMSTRLELGKQWLDCLYSDDSKLKKKRSPQRKPRNYLRKVKGGTRTGPRATTYEAKSVHVILLRLRTFSQSQFSYY
jgi:hypothetical protein